MGIKENTTNNEHSLLLWADCEFTGLDLRQGHKIIEIGALVTDLALREIDSHQDFIKYEWSSIEELMSLNPWWTDRTDDKERMKEGNRFARPVEEVDTTLHNLVEEYFPTTQPALCGNSVWNDKKHIENQLPLLDSALSYQVIDVSSLKLIAIKYRNIEYRGKVHKHYSIDDIRESMDEFRYLMGHLGIADLSLLVKDEPHLG